MIGTPIKLVDMARDVAFDLTDEDKIALAVETILTVKAGGNGPALRAAARQIDQHAQMLGRGESRRSEYKFIQFVSNIERPREGWVIIRSSEAVYNLALKEKLSLRGFLSAIFSERLEQQMRDIQNRPRRGESLPRRSEFEVEPITPLANKFGRVVIAARIRHFGIKIKSLIHDIVNPAKSQGGRKNVR